MPDISYAAPSAGRDNPSVGNQYVQPVPISPEPCNPRVAAQSSQQQHARSVSLFHHTFCALSDATRTQPVRPVSSSCARSDTSVRDSWPRHLASWISGQHPWPCVTGGSGPLRPNPAAARPRTGSRRRAAKPIRRAGNDTPRPDDGRGPRECGARSALGSAEWQSEYGIATCLSPVGVPRQAVEPEPGTL